MNPRPTADPRPLAWAPRAALLVLLAAIAVLALQQWLLHVERRDLARAPLCERCQHLSLLPE